MRNMKPALLCALSLLSLPLAAQWSADRHPLYDAAAPTKEQKAAAATALSLQVVSSRRIDAAQEEQAPFVAYDENAGLPVLLLRGWRGERVNAQLLIRANGKADNLRVSCTLMNAPFEVQTRMVRYTKAHGRAVGDIIGTESRCDNPAGVPRPVWVQADIPHDTPAGSYCGLITVQADGCEAVRQPIMIEVTPDTLPAPREWQMHFDLWQHPDAVARWHDVEPWSDTHLALMKPLMQRLADAGQKVITCAIIDEAWNAQTYDWFPSQIRWIKGQDGQMRYDYSVFDKWVSFMMNEVGIDREIFCYTMVPWSMQIRCFDEASGTDITLPLDHKDDSYERLWGHFLTDFKAHLQAKGWLEKTSIALDERPDDLVRATKRVIQQYAPELRIISSVNHPSEESKDIYLVSPILQHVGSLTPELLAQRRAHGLKSIYYTCLSPAKPNSFTMSPPDESEWLGIFAAAQGLDGYSRWAYNSWTRNPFETTDFKQWPSGDCFMVYPGNLSSIRFERLRDGVEDYEKIRLLREYAARTDSLKAQQAVKRLNEELKTLFTIKRSQGSEHSQDVETARRLIEETADALRGE